MLLQLEHDGALDISPGDAAFEVTDSLELPVDVQVLGVYPHAHYLGKTFEGTARLPDGTSRWLIRIPNWDLNWQGVFQLAEPLWLPRGTVLSMRWVYDNTQRQRPQPEHAADSGPGRKPGVRRNGALLGAGPARASRGRLLLQDALMRARLRQIPGRLRGAGQPRIVSADRRASR